MMHIKETCCCGAVFEVTDSRGTYATHNTGGKPDSKGRIFQIEVMRDRWKEEHAECIKKATTIKNLRSHYAS